MADAIQRAEHHVRLCNQILQHLRSLLQPAVMVQQSPLPPFDRGADMRHQRLTPADVKHALPGDIDGRLLGRGRGLDGGDRR